jgi:hypothetical protein
MISINKLDKRKKARIMCAVEIFLGQAKQDGYEKR